MEIPLQEFERAAQRLKGVLHHTELDLSATFSAMTGGNIYLKYENSQKTGSFKIRGASNKIAALVERGETGAVVASSAGNHAQGVAYAAHRFGIPATIVMPKTAPIAKAKATEGYGATVVLAGDCYDDAYAKACEICEQEHATFLHPYNDPEVIAGQGTLGLEILGDLPTADIVIVPAGGGGLLAGERDFGHRIFFDVLGLVLRLPDDILGLSTGFGDDLRCLFLSLGDQTVGFGASFLQPLVVELLSQLLKFVFHSVI